MREALIYTYDFERRSTATASTPAPTACSTTRSSRPQGLPSAGELKLLEPFREELPPEVFGPAYVAPRTNGDPKLLRQNLLKARDLLEAAGWKVAADGRLRNAKGEPFEVEYLDAGDRGTDRARVAPQPRQARRHPDAAQRRLRAVPPSPRGIRLRHGHDRRGPTSRCRRPADLITSYGSKAADEKGNNNLRGVKSAAVDHLLDVMANAHPARRLRDAAARSIAS